MIDIRKMMQGKNLTPLDEQLLHYIIEHMDTVLEQGVRGIAKANFTSPSTVVRLSKKLGYTGFIDLYYQLVPLVQHADQPSEADTQNFLEVTQADFFTHNQQRQVDMFVEKVLRLQQSYIFVYATGFSAIAAEYLYKKLLVLGKKTIIATGTDSVGVFENNLEDIGAFVGISKSGETQQVLDKIQLAKAHDVFTITFTKETINRGAELADLNFKIPDDNKLDDRNMLPNIFFARLIMLFEFMIKTYLEQQSNNNNKK